MPATLLAFSLYTMFVDNFLSLSHAKHIPYVNIDQTRKTGKVMR